MSYLPIEDHGVIGDLETVALVGMDGAVDFLCFPEFDSPTLFASLLDSEKGGTFRLAPILEDVRHRQLYLPDTNVLLTRFLSDEGVSEITDFMTVGPMKHTQHLVRQAKSVRGEIRYRMTCAPRFNYARSPHRVEPTDDGVLFISEGPDQIRLHLRTTIPVAIQNGAVVAEFVLKPEEKATFVLETAEEEVIPSYGLEDYVEEALRTTVNYWREWVSKSNYRGRWRESVYRSALILKLLISEKHGAMVAAPTFGVPERIGGPLNWDYRYCWIRDTSFAMMALLQLGYHEEAAAFVRWIEGRCREVDPDGSLKVMYRLDGGQNLAEHELQHLEGYLHSRPVRIGNGAHSQLQLDIYGELLQFIWIYSHNGQMVSFDLWQSIIRMINWVCEHWEQPDDGIWEFRGNRLEFLYSRFMCWVAIDRAMRVGQKHSFPMPFDHWMRSRDAIYNDILTNFWDEQRYCFTGTRRSQSVDSAILLMPLVEFISPEDPRWVGTLRVIEQELVSDSLVYRYVNERGEPAALQQDEGTFCMCSFWYAESLARTGRSEEARFYFEKMMGYANHLGIYSEELGLKGEHLGNIPQAFTHFALIEAAITMDHVLSRSGERI